METTNKFTENEKKLIFKILHEIDQNTSWDNFKNCFITNKQMRIYIKEYEMKDLTNILHKIQ